MKNTTKRLSLLSLLTSLALILSFVESQLPPIYPSIPGIKVGLANIVIIYSLYSLCPIDTIAISLIRVFTVSLLFGNALVLAYSLSGAILSFLVMLILKKLNKFSCVGVSVAGAVSHNLGQIGVAILLLNTPQIGYYMIILALTGAIAGILIGLCAAILIKRTKSIKF